VQINLPSAWNGRFFMYGNGGYAGEPAEQYAEVRDKALAEGFATAWTDTGHRSNSSDGQFTGGQFAMDPVAFKNYTYYAVHATAAFAKMVIGDFYKAAPNYSYWSGCSTGGRQGVMEAYRYPTDFNGILAGAPVVDGTSMMIKGLWRQTATERTGLTLGKLQTAFRAALAVCDAKDGLKDGLISDPRKCDFNPRRDVAQCTENTKSDACLTEKQAEALQKIYDGPPKVAGTPNWVRDYPGIEDKSVASGWVLDDSGADKAKNRLAVMADSWMKYFSFKNPSYDASTFNFKADPARAREPDRLMNPKLDFDKFIKFGGKMITYWGWADTALNPAMGINFYDHLVAKYGLSKTQAYYRLFMIPGMAHCSGGYGPSLIDGLPQLIDWVEKGDAPNRLPAKSPAGDKAAYNRSYCKYPEVTRYRSGDKENPENYVCEAPVR
jgi:feruloyl esterase